MSTVTSSPELDRPQAPGEKDQPQAYTVEDAHPLVNEHDLTPRAAIKAYPWAICWCLAVSMCVIMEGYDLVLISNFYAYPTFQQKYGNYVGFKVSPNSGYQLTPAWQAGLGNAAGVGAFFGTFANGYLVGVFGHRRVIVVSLVFLTCLIFIPFFSPNIVVLLIGQLLCGLPWGIFATAAPAYASEVLPMCLRVFLTSWTNMCFIIGQLIAAGVLRSLSSRTDEWGFRIPFALQWMWPVFLIPLLCFAPDSPWHEVRHNRLDKAEAALRRLQSAKANIDVKDTLASIIHTNALEQELNVGTSYWDCFKGAELRRTEIACVCFMGQVLAGTPFAYNASYFFTQIGFSTKISYTLNVGVKSLALVGTLVNWFALMPRLGRRTVYVTGMFILTLILFLIGILNIFRQHAAVRWTQAILTLSWTFFFQLSIGQLGWALPAEIGSTRLRQKTICVARNAYYITNVVAGVLQPYFMNPTAWNLRGYTGFVWGSTALCIGIWAFFRLPESKGRTYEELDILFAQKIPARKFKTANVDQSRSNLLSDDKISA